MHPNQHNLSPQHGITHKEQNHIDLLLQIVEHIQIIKEQKDIQFDDPPVWPAFVLGLTSIKGDHPVDTEEDEPGDDDNGEAPVEVDGVGAVNGDPTQKKEYYDVVDELHHVNIV